jgi:hypothetical protein
MTTNLIRQGIAEWNGQAFSFGKSLSIPLRQFQMVDTPFGNVGFGVWDFTKPRLIHCVNIAGFSENFGWGMGLTNSDPNDFNGLDYVSNPNAFPDLPLWFFVQGVENVLISGVPPRPFRYIFMQTLFGKFNQMDARIVVEFVREDRLLDSVHKQGIAK